METDLASATCAGPQRLRLSGLECFWLGLSEPLDGINRRLWFFHCASGSFAAQPTSVPSAAATNAAATAANCGVQSAAAQDCNCGIQSAAGATEEAQEAQEEQEGPAAR